MKRSAEDASFDGAALAEPDRKLPAFYFRGGIEQVSKALAEGISDGSIDRVMLPTGFNVDLDADKLQKLLSDPKTNPDFARKLARMPETDGPIGTAVLGDALRKLGVQATYVVPDALNESVLRAAIGVLRPEQAQFTRIVKFDAFLQGRSATDAAEMLLSRYQPDFVFSTEVPGRTLAGEPFNLRGLPIRQFNEPLDEITLVANTWGIPTAGVIDGGNEVGAGHEFFKGKIPLATNGREMASAVPVAYPITAWNSNLGAEGVAAALLKAAGRLDELPSSSTLVKMIHTALDAGAVDGVTRKAIAGERVPDAFGKLRTTGVDGFAAGYHGTTLDRMRDAALQTDLGFTVTSKPEEWVHLVLSDSGNGGLFAARNLKGCIEANSRYRVQLSILGDHGVPGGAYGNLTDSQLALRAGDMARAGELLGGDIQVNVRNTAGCALMDRDLAALGIKSRMVNLVATTQEAMVAIGGERIFALSTPATANEMAHVVDMPRTVEEVFSVVACIPKDATSVWLSCTHYFALMPEIEAAMKQYGLGHIPVIDPMQFQAESVVSVLDRMQESPEFAGFSGSPNAPTRVLTTGDANVVGKNAAELLQDPHARTLHTDFGGPLSPEAFAEYFGGRQGRLSPECAEQFERRARPPWWARIWHKYTGL